MKTVPQLIYERYTLERAGKAFEVFKQEYEKAECAEGVIQARENLIKEIKSFSTASSLANMRFTLDSRDEFYKGEREYYDEIGPLVMNYMSEYGKMMLESKFRKDLERKMNPVLFKMWEVAALAHDPKIVEEEQKENAIVTEYNMLMSQMQFDYQGKKVPLSLVRGDLTNKDREVRKQAAESIGKGLQANAEKLDEIMDRLVKIRDLQAKKLGYKDFITLGYYRMGRIDYNREMVADFKKNVLNSIVPIVKKMKEDLAKEMGIDKIMLYDNEVYSLTGNPRPKLDKEGIFKAAQEMYNEMNPEIGAFMKKMIATEAFDVDSRDGKWGGGYCTEFADYEQVFILANFNGSADDVDVVTHEFGHAFAMEQAFQYGDFEMGVGGMETAECHSMSMEYLSWKYMDKFFEDVKGYKKRHLSEGLSFLPYGVIVDEFQHKIYENPELTPAERKAEWNKLESKYRPYMSTKGIPYLEEGTRWQFQMHIFETPFYYIDYVLASTVAMAFLVSSRKDYDLALKKYIELSRAGGTKFFSQLVKDAGVAYPFGKGTLEELGKEILRVLEELK
ncbi:MAG: M3 family oligoendopeptidase [Clostridia bacterium]|jgi:M3 family oligoendopeptidase